MCEQEHGTQTALVQWVLHSRMRAGVRTSIRAQHVGSAQRDARPSVPAKDVEPQQSHVQAHASKHTDAQPFHALAASPTDPALATSPSPAARRQLCAHHKATAAAGFGGSPAWAKRAGAPCQCLPSPVGQRSSHACCSRALFLSKCLQPRG